MGSTGISVVLFHDNKPLEVCETDYMGVLGVRVKTGCSSFPVNYPLEIGFIGKRKIYIDDEKVTFKVTSYRDGYLYLRLRHYTPDTLRRWCQIILDLCDEEDVSSIKPVSVH